MRGRSHVLGLHNRVPRNGRWRQDTSAGWQGVERLQSRAAGNGRWWQGFSVPHQAHQGQIKNAPHFGQYPNFDINPFAKIFRDKPFIKPVLDLPSGNRWLNHFACLQD